MPVLPVLINLLDKLDNMIFIIENIGMIFVGLSVSITAIAVLISQILGKHRLWMNQVY